MWSKEKTLAMAFNATPGWESTTISEWNDQEVCSLKAAIIEKTWQLDHLQGEYEKLTGKKYEFFR